MGLASARVALDTIDAFYYGYYGYKLRKSQEPTKQEKRITQSLQERGLFKKVSLQEAQPTSPSTPLEKVFSEGILSTKIFKSLDQSAFRNFSRTSKNNHRIASQIAKSPFGLRQFSGNFQHGLEGLIQSIFKRPSYSYIFPCRLHLAKEIFFINPERSFEFNKQYNCGEKSSIFETLKPEELYHDQDQIAEELCRRSVMKGFSNSLAPNQEVSHFVAQVVREVWQPGTFLSIAILRRAAEKLQSKFVMDPNDPCREYQKEFLSEPWSVLLYISNPELRDLYPDSIRKYFLDKLLGIDQNPIPQDERSPHKRLIAQFVENDVLNAFQELIMNVRLPPLFGDFLEFFLMDFEEINLFLNNVYPEYLYDFLYAKNAEAFLFSTLTQKVHAHESPALYASRLANVSVKSTHIPIG